MGLILKSILAAFWLVLVPGLAGAAYFGWSGGKLSESKKAVKNVPGGASGLWTKTDRESMSCLADETDRPRSVGEYLLAGYVLLFAIMELLTLPMIFLKVPFHVLAVIFGAVALVLGGTGTWELYRNYKKDQREALSQGTENKKVPEKPLAKKSAMSNVRRLLSGRNGVSWTFVVALVLILAQIAVVVLFAHMDADDVFYVGTAVTDVDTDTLYTISPYTGNPYTRLPKRYVLSPFPEFLAVISRLLGGFHPAIVAHTVFPAVFLALVYLVLYEYSRRFFKENVEARGTFLILSVLLLSFCGFSVYNSGTFAMIRIWQGKALLAGVFLPWLFLLCMEVLLKERGRYPWSLLFLTNGACCLLSSMGIMLAPLMMGIFLLISLVKFRDLHRFLKGLVCCMPSLLLGMVYILVF